MANLEINGRTGRKIEFTAHARARMCKRGIGEKTVDLVSMEGSVYSSKYNDDRLEVMFSKKDKKRVENEIKMEIRKLENLRKKYCGREITNNVNAISGESISIQISQLRKRLQEIDRATNKQLVLAGGLLVTCFHKNRFSKSSHQRNGQRRKKCKRWG